MFAEHSIVVLNREVSDMGLHAGDVGSIVHVYGGGIAFEVEFVSGDGKTVALMTLQSDDIRPIGAGEVLHTRLCDLAERSDAPERE